MSESARTRNGVFNAGGDISSPAVKRFGSPSGRKRISSALIISALFVLLIWQLYELLATQVKDELVARLEARTGAAVTISGTVGLALEPAIAARAKDLRLKWADGTQITIQSLVAEFSAATLNLAHPAVGLLRLSGVIADVSPSPGSIVGFADIVTPAGLPNISVTDLVVNPATADPGERAVFSIDRLTVDSHGAALTVAAAASSRAGNLDAVLELGGQVQGSGRPLKLSVMTGNREMLSGVGHWRESPRILHLELGVSVDRFHAAWPAVVGLLQRQGLRPVELGLDRMSARAVLRADPHRLQLGQIRAVIEGYSLRASVGGDLATDYQTFDGSRLDVALSGSGGLPIYAPLPGLGKYPENWEITARAARETGRWTLADVRLTANGPNRLAVSAHGQGIVRDHPEAGRPRAVLGGRLWWRADMQPNQKPEWMGVPWLIEGFSGTANWRVMDADLDLDQLSITVRGPSGALVTTEGGLRLSSDSYAFDLSVVLRKWPVIGPTSSGFLQGLGLISTTGTLALAGDGGRIRASEVDLDLKAGEGAKWRVKGAVGRIEVSGSRRLSEVDLKVLFDMPMLDLEKLSLPWGRIGRTHGSFRLSGTAPALVVRDIELYSVTDDGTELHARGEVARFNERRPASSEGVSLKVTANLKDTAVLARAGSADIPITGPLRVNAHVEGDVARLGIPRLEASARLGGRLLSVSGRITNLTGEAVTTAELSLRLSAAGKTGSQAGAVMIGDVELVLSRGGVRVVAGRFISGGADGGTVDLSGWLFRPNRALRQDLNFHFRRLTGSWWSSVSNLKPPWAGAWSGTLRYARGTTDRRYSGNIKLNDSEAVFDLVRNDTSGASLEGVVRIPKLHLVDLGIRPQRPVWRGPENGTGRSDMFSEEVIQPIWRDGVQLDIDLTINRLIGRNVEVRGIQGKLYRDSREVSVTGATATWKGGRIRFDAHALHGDDVPLWTLAVNAQGIDVDSLLSQWWSVSPLSGILDITATLRTKGNSADLMARNLAGDLHLVVGHGAVKDSDIDILSGDAIDWLFAEKGAPARTALNCLVGRFEISKGIAASRVLAFETDATIARGKGFFDLGNERLELKFRAKPKQKKVAALSSLFKISGHMANPQVKVGKTTGLKLAGNTVLAPVNALGALFRGSAKEQKRFGHVCGRRSSARRESQPGARTPGVDDKSK